MPGKGDIHNDPKANTNGFDKNPQNIGGGRPKGVKNRSTVARQILDMVTKYPKDIMENLKAVYPQIEDSMTMEEIMTIVQANKAIVDKDTAAYKALMDSGYGMPKQEIEQTNIDQFENMTDEEIENELKELDKSRKNKKN